MIPAPALRQALRFATAGSPWTSGDLIRSELFSIERLEQHARSLAAAQRIAQSPRSRRSLGGRLRRNEAVLLAAYRTLAAAVAENRPVTPAAEWLLDNYHLVEEQIREIREDLPPSFYRLLPKLDAEPLRGYPRVFGVAWAFVAHTDSRFDPETLRRFVRAYQSIEPLTIGELWAVAITLRIVLIENLRRAAASIVANRAARQDADAVADRLLGMAGAAAEPDALLRWAAKGETIAPAFMVQLVQRLRDQDPIVTPALLWLERRLTSQGTTSDRIVYDELQKQGASNVTVRNIITSMRLLSDLDWAEFFESVSLVDESLRGASDFAAMDFPTRNSYRAAVEQIARGANIPELAVARAALAAAGAATTPRAADPGYHLIADGRRAFEDSLGFRTTLRSWTRRFAVRRGVGGYVVAISLLGGLVLGTALSLPGIRGIDTVRLALLGLLGCIPALDAAVALVNRIAARCFGATTLPALALRGGIPADLKTLVVVPALLTTRAALEAQIDRLEVHYLASPDGELHFALLSDWADAPTESLASDAPLLECAAAGIADLNRRHASKDRAAPFLLLHRRRVWSTGQRLWMGWERKRGKLHELNRLLRGAADTTFMGEDGRPPAVPSDVRFVITLDADTRLPREAARRLVGKMAHPLNRPLFDPSTGQVTDGYAVLQPRVAPSLPTGCEGSRFQRIFSSASGIDPYAAAASDVYQDLFGEGSYAGKGIYDIDAFEAALAGRVLDDSLLSHDLFEGIFARSGLVSDIQVVEEFPARYDVAAARQHRWARGDWQLLPWILGRRDAAGTSRGSGAVSLIGMWKMLDNLRRTLSAPLSVGALLVGWTLPPAAALAWTGFIVLSIALPALIPLIGAIVPSRAGISWRSHLYALRADLLLAFEQTAFLIVFLAYQAWLMSDAVTRTLFRLCVSRRNLLQWVTAAQIDAGGRLDLPGAYWRMSGGVLVAVAGLIVAVRGPIGMEWVALPFIIAWLAAPAVAVWISISPRVAGRVTVGVADRQALRQIARRTWRYFETHVTAEDGMLPPDNFQEDPHPVVAHRTSPTNMGLYLLAAVGARDFGWLGTLDTVERIEATLATMHTLQRFRGHFYNWYDTRDRRALEPRYVSTVDSGNLAAHLLTVANACRHWREHPPTPADAAAVTAAGSADCLGLARECLGVLPDDRKAQSHLRDQLSAAFDALEATLGAGAGLQAAPATASAMAATMMDITHTLTGELAAATSSDLIFWTGAAQRALQSHARDAQPEATELATPGSLPARLAAIETEARAMAQAMEFGFLLDTERRLLSIGFLTDEGRLDPNCYDLLASEARLASFIAIAKNDVPARHWFRLGRAVTPVGHGAALISWSGSMFEYLMPSLVLRAPEGSLLDQTNRLIVGRQIGYGGELGVPWGISESAYNARDLEMTYQYSNFGVPGLGLKRGLGQSTVIAPYATALAAMVDPAAAVENFTRLRGLGTEGRFGFYEALDFTPSRVPDGTRDAVVRTFMAHHQGMTVVALANVLFDGRMRDRFHAEPMIEASELLLQERTPRDVSVSHPRAEEVSTGQRLEDARIADVRRLSTAHDAVPQVHLLSNGRYAVMLTAAGSGYSRWGDFAVTRWREDATRDDMGSFVFLRDVDSGTIWSAGYQPCGVEPDRYEVTFTEDRAEIARAAERITTVLEVIVSPEDDVEVRRISIANTGSRHRDIDVTSYAELVLAPPAADAAHPAFSKMFVQTEYVAKEGVLLATRRRRTAAEPQIWAGHQAVVEGESLRPPEYETDRARFLGRGREIRDAIAIHDGRPLSNTTGTVLDPVFALRHRLRIPARGKVVIAYWTGVAPTRQGVLDLLDKHQDANAFVRAGTLAWTQAQVQSRHLGIDAAEANLFQRLASHVLFANPSMRSSSDAIQRGSGGPSALWAQGISGDLPIVLVRIDDVEEIDIARQLLRAHEYWRLKLLAVDLVILNERASSYVQDLQNALEAQVRMSQSSRKLPADNPRGAVFVLRKDLISEQTRAMLASVARVVLSGQRGSLSDQLDRHREPALPPGTRGRAQNPGPAAAPPRPVPALEFFNGLGGFSADGSEYVTLLGPGQSTPAPWINVIANPHFGFQVSADGSGYTWSRNSRENQLTPWSNDPVSDRPGEALYLRDDETGEVLGATALPLLDAGATYEVRHGQGYSRFMHTAAGVALELTQFVPIDDPVKISRLSVRNLSDGERSFTLTAYAEWVLGQSRAAAAPFIVTEADAATGALFARNPWSAAAAGHVAFSDLCGQQTAWSCDRREFLGRHGSLDGPASLVTFAKLSQRAGAGLDPCAVLQTGFTLEPGARREFVWLLGEAADAAQARALITHYRNADVEAVLTAVRAQWDDVLGAVQVKTPDRAFDLMQNRWLLYQTLVCRFWARSAFYQASGAYGFRDQLQDSMALVTTRPDLTREHLLRAAGRQFREGDVQHWWLPQAGQGVRTRISDDRVWLAFVAAHYVSVSGDTAVFDVEVPFIEGQALRPEEHDVYFEPVASDETATLFEHCALALDQSLATGVHGLPLMGTGDWNDGMNCVGAGGKGESIWLGWFLYATLQEFAPYAAARGEPERAARWTAVAAAIAAALERYGWDGSWYLRAYFDDGTPLGSARDLECRIDSIAQSWAVLSGAAAPDRALQAMAAVQTQLIDADAGLALLFTPPFDHTPLDPGYIKGYPPGIRENGGQYTHAALWSVMALARLGHGTQAGLLFALLNPVNQAGTRAAAQRYKVEPYVVAADVYSVAPHVGRGGWTWYTGSAGWMYRAGLESILGLRIHGATLELSPCLPEHWPSATISYKRGSTRYDIAIENPGRVSRGIIETRIDGIIAPIPGGPMSTPIAVSIPWVDDGAIHRIRLLLGAPNHGIAS